jgi:hypothetical protein
MPVNKTMPYQWYETPNIHFCSILDFEKLCKDLDFNIKKKVFLTSNHCLSGIFGNELFSNLFAKYGIFLITKNEFKSSNQEEFAFKTLVSLGYKTAISNYDYKKIKIND